MAGPAFIPAPVCDLLVAACEREAVRIGCPMAIALVDAAGELIRFLRMDGTLPASTELAQGKAWSAAALRMGTDVLGRLAQPGAELFGIGESLGGRLVLFGGGLPLRLGGAVAGAVGVSGGSVGQDMQVASRAVELLAAMEDWAARLTLRLGSSAPLPPALLTGLAGGLRQEISDRIPEAAGEVPALIGGTILAMA